MLPYKLRYDLKQSMKDMVCVFSCRESTRRRVSRSKKLLKSVRICLNNARSLKKLKLKQSRLDLARLLKQYSREDVAQLLKRDILDSAFSKAEQHLKNQNILDALDLLDHFCELIFINLPYICRARVLPIDINEAVASLSFAAAKCKDDLPELQRLWELFNEQYTDDFAMPGNHVNREIIEKLCIKNIAYEQKLRLIEEIAMEEELFWGLYSDHDWEEEFYETGSSISQAQEENIVYEDDIDEQPILPEENELKEYDPPMEDYDSDLEEVLYRTDCSTSLIQENQDKFIGYHDDRDEQPIMREDGEGNTRGLNLLDTEVPGPCPPSSLSHVHPKLPDYDDLVAKFTAIKEKYQRNISVGDINSSTFSDPKKKVSLPNYHAPISSEDVSCKEVGDCKSYFQPSSLSHVHPKLPDYDYLVAKFTAIKNNILYGSGRP